MQAMEIGARRCLASVGVQAIVDILRDDGRTLHTGETHEEILRQYPDAFETTVDEAEALLDSLAITAPEEIDQESFIDALECLPPLHWHGTGATESFMMSEFYRGQVTTVLVRLGNRFFKFRDRAQLTHAACVGKVEAWLAAGAPQKEDGVRKEPDHG